MAKLLELSEKSQDSKLITSISGNALAPPIYSMTPTEGVVLKDLYGLEKVAQLFPIYNMTGKIYLSKDCTYSEAMRQMQSSWKRNRREGRVLSCPPYKSTEILEKIKFCHFYRKIKRQENEEQIKFPPSYV